MDTVLGVSMAPTTVRVVLVAGEDAGGVTVDEDNFDVGEEPTTVAAPDQVVAAILGTREAAAEGGYRLLSTGVTWTDPADAAALRDALAARKVENVMLVSAFLAAAALAQSVGNATGYAHTGLLFVEPTCATLAVVHSADGSISDVYRQPLAESDAEAVTQIAGLVAGADALDSHPNGLFVMGSDGIDVVALKPHLEAATPLPLSMAEEQLAALAKGAALASAHAPLFASSTAAMGYARDPGTGEVHYPATLEDATTRDIGVRDAAWAGQNLAYAAVADDDDDDSFTVAGGDAFDAYPDYRPEPLDTRKPFLTAMGVLTVFVVGVVALVLALAISIRPHVRQRPELGQKIVVPAQQAPAPQNPVPQAPPPAAPAPAAVAPAPAPAPAAPPPAAPPAIPRLPLPGPPAAPPPGPPLPLPGPGPGLPGPGLPGPGIPGPRLPVPGPAIPHLPGPHLPGIPGL